MNETSDLGAPSPGLTHCLQVLMACRTHRTSVGMSPSMRRAGSGWGQRPALPLACCVVDFGKRLHISEPQFPNVENGGKTSPYLVRFL